MIVRRLLATASVIMACGCASTPPPPPPAPVITYEQRLAWILRLEDQRQLRDPALPAPAPVAAPQRGGPVVTASPPPPPDLFILVNDTDARVRRRAALAIGRVGLTAGS